MYGCLNSHSTDRGLFFLTTTSGTIRIYIARLEKYKLSKLQVDMETKELFPRVLLLCRQDMPYLPDGTPVDIIFNPLGGVPSRMNTGCGF
jgi:DNA-directed RNA polymerase subunit beta